MQKQEVAQRSCDGRAILSTANTPLRKYPLRRPSVFIATWEVVIFFVGLNLIDYAIVALFALSVLVGLHRGTVAHGG